MKDTIEYDASNVKNSCSRRQLGEEEDGSGSGLVVGSTIFLEEIPEEQLG